MFGQGSPNFHRYPRGVARCKANDLCRGRCAPRARILVALLALIALLFCCDANVSHAQNTPQLNPVSNKGSGDLKLRFAWGGGVPQKWQGRIEVENGTFVSSRPLAITADAPSTVVRRNKELVIDHRISTSYGGVDVSITATENTLIRFALTSDSGQTYQRSWSVNDAASGITEPLDKHQNRITISRVPGDNVHIGINRPHLVFEPGETWRFETGLRRSSLAEQNVSANFYWTNSAGRGSRKPATASSIQLSTDASGTSEKQTTEITLPQTDGAHNLLIEFEAQPSKAAFGQFRRPKKVTRCVQLVVVSTSTPANDTTPWKAFRTWTSTELHGDFRNSWPKLPGSKEPGRQGRLSLVPVNDSQSEALQLESESSLSIPIHSPSGRKTDGPIRVSIRYRSIPGTKLAVNYLSASQQVLHGMDSGVAVPISPAGVESKDQWLTHRFHIWPEETAGHLYIANDALQAAQIGEIQFEAGPSRLPAAISSAVTPSETTRRQRLAFFESPDFGGNFQAQRVNDPQTGQALDDWNTFYDSIDRLTQYLKASSFDGAFVTVAADGSALFPSSGLASGPRFDSGVFASGGCDPVQKDVVELMLRMFDREGLSLIPVLTLNSSIESLESLREAPVMSFDLVADDGQRVDFNRQLLPIYNPLDPTLKALCTREIDRFAKRYDAHRSVAGVALTCGPDCCTLLPGAENGLDNVTVQRFLESQNIDPASFDPASLQKPHGTHSEAWLSWRSQQMASWYTGIAQQTENNLYLLPVDLYRRQEFISSMSPSLQHAGNFDLVMREMGLDFDSDEHQGVAVLAPQQIAPGFSLSQRRVELNTCQSRVAEQFISRGTSGAIFAHRGNWRTIDAPASGSTSKQAARLQLYTPGGSLNRRRYIEMIRKYDCRLFVEGGSSLARGGDSELESLLRTIRELPAQKFEDVGDPRTGPVCMRQLSIEGQHYFYAVNDSPWPVQVTARLQRNQAPQVLLASANRGGGVAPLTTFDGNEVLLKRLQSGTEMQIILEPWSIYAGVAETNSDFNPYAIKDFQVALPEGSDSLMRKRLHQLKSKLAKAKIAKPLPQLLNGSFEVFADPDKSGWEFDNHDQAKFDLDSQAFREGRVSLSMQTEGKPVSIRSNLVPLPKTGRLTVSAWCRTTAANGQAQPRLSLEGISDGSDFYRYLPIGQTAAEQTPLNETWQKFVVHFDDLPEDLSNLRIGFDLIGAGQLSIDDVQIFDRWFDENDAVAMTQLLASAGTRLQNADTIDSGRRVLESYWVQFLDQHIGREEEPLRKEARNTFEIPLPKLSPGAPNRVPLFQRLQK